MLDSLRKGTAVENHLEPSYFVAMTSALDAALAGSDDGEGDAPGGRVVVPCSESLL